MTEVKYIINGNGKIAIVEAKVSDELLTIKAFRTALTTALNNWCNITPEGRVAWDESLEKFNVGDLTCVDKYRKLKDYLMVQSIADLRVTIEMAPAATEVEPQAAEEDDFFDEGPWRFDTVLITDARA